MSSWHSYPKIYNLGHAAIAELFHDPIVAEEKVDGSQFSFGRFGEEIKMRSKGQQMTLDHFEGMFKLAVDWVRENAPNLIDGWTYRAEFLAKPKHNVLAYDRVPEKHLIIFDINSSEEGYLPPLAKIAEAERLGLECVPQYIVCGPDQIKNLLEHVSCLGGQKIEGLVFKNYHRFGVDKKVLMGKHVSEAFKEVHKGDWRERNPTGGDVVQELILKYKTPARWQKALQHLKERGECTDSPKDIGPLMKEVNVDILAECKGEIMEALFNYAWPKMSRGVCSGLPQWYKSELFDKQFAEAGEDPEGL